MSGLHPMSAEIMNQQPNYPGGGFPAGPISFPNIQPSGPFAEWYPRGATSSLSGVAGFIDSQPVNGDVTEIYGIDNIPKQFLCAPWEDESERFIMPGMIAFCVKEYDAIESTSLILTLSKVNQVMYDAYNDFDELVKYGDLEANEFKGYLELFGEKALEMYHQHLKKPTAEVDPTLEGKLKRFQELAVKDHYCWLTKFGILNKIEYLGVVNNTNRAISLEGIRQNNHYVNVNVIMGKRCEVANLFGDLEHVDTGSKLWLLLRRKARIANGEITYKEFTIVPHGCRYKDYPRQLDEEYKDPSGRFVRGWHWTVGSVLNPPRFSPQNSQITTASNTGNLLSERLAYEEHALLPTMYVALGFK